MPKLLIHVAEGERRVVAVNTVYCAEAVRGNTLIRRRAARAILDIRELGAVERAWRRYGFVRIHDQHLVHPDRVLRIRKLCWLALSSAAGSFIISDFTSL